jgi:putative cell wall-binding protein
MLAVVLAVLGGLVGIAPSAGADAWSDEWEFVARINQARRDAGLAPLGVLAPLQDLARAQSARMAAQNRLHHNPNLAADLTAAVPDWQRGGENVGVGYDVAGLHAAFMASPGHRANVLGDWRYMAVGVVHAGGKTWVTELFVKAPAGKPLLALPVPPSAPPAPRVPVTRIGGHGPTPLAVAGQFPDRGASGVVVARDDVFADALAGAALATALRGPVLFAGRDAVDPAVVREAARVLAPGGTVYLLGGPAALGPSVAAAFAGAGLPTVRVGGADRFETAAAVARLVDPAPREVLVASGTNFADAVVAGPTGRPVVLVAPDRVPEATAAYLQTVPDARRVVVGGPAVVPDAVAAAVGAAERVAGADRFETAVRVAARWFPGATGVSLAPGDSFADALAGAAWSGRLGVPVLLAGPSASSGTAAFLRSLPGLAGAVVYGTVPDAVVAALLA